MRTAGDPFAADLIETLAAGRREVANHSDSLWRERTAAKRIEKKGRGPGGTWDGDEASRASGNDALLFEAGKSV